jgi:CubicO group peptidase (beta-lactamase class C family)
MQGTHAGSADRSGEVEAGLLPAVAIRGRPRASMALADRMEHYRVPGVSVAVVDGGRIVWARGYGVAEAGGECAVDERTLFQAASISKPVTALVVLMLVERGLLDLDEDVNWRLRSWRLPESPMTSERRVTLRRILSHTAGLSLSGIPGYAPGTPLPTLNQLLDGLPPATNAPVRVEREPGSAFQYSGGGYCIAEQLITDVTRREFPDLAKEMVLEPLGMTDSAFAQPLPPKLEPRAATGHGSGGVPMPGRWLVPSGVSAGGLWTTPSDLARFAVELQRAHAGRSKLLGRALAKEMLTAQDASHVGLGPWMEGERTSARFYHTGSNLGYRARLVGYPQGGSGAVVMTNGENGELLCIEVLNAIASVYGWPDYIVEKEIADVDRTGFASFAGEYEIVGGYRLTVRHEDGRLFASAPGYGAGEMHPASETSFFVEEVPAEITFTAGEESQPSLLVRLFGMELRGKRA